ncbi:MAG: hypothetical protein GEU68_12460 [Actinobacteria bacterium]|jgi:hypothetical protein|nr:hypothetical protein [Actinomycetota bacterium]
MGRAAYRNHEAVGDRSEPASNGLIKGGLSLDTDTLRATGCELLASSYLHRSHLGDLSSLEAAKIIAAEIDNLSFVALLEAGPVPAR